MASWEALGGGAAGLNQETDYFIHGSDCVSKNAWASDLKGMIYDNGAGFTVPTDGAVLAWITHATPNSLAAKASGGIQLLVGDDDTNFYQFYVGGYDTLDLGGIWVPYVANPDNTLEDTSTGSPTSSHQWAGGQADLPTGGPTKGSPFGIDAMRYGRCRLDYTFGDLTNGYNTFDGAEGYGNAVSRRWGLLEYFNGVYLMQGFHRFGITSGNLVDFRDSNKVIYIRPVDRVTSGFNRIEIQNGSSNVEWTNISISSLSTVSPGVFIITAGTVIMTSCLFVDMGAFTFLSSTTVNDTIFRRCAAITAPGADMVGSQVLQSTVAADASALIWDVATDPDGYLDDMSFSKGTNAHHAIEFGTNSPLTMTLRGVDFSGFTNTIGNNAAPLYIKRTSGTVTINLVGCTGIDANGYKSDGATVNIVSNPVTLSVHVQDAITGADISGARVLALAASGGPNPYQESVSLVRSGSTVTVTHNGHGLATNDYVLIEGCNEGDYNGVWQITVTGINEYTFIIGTTPSSPATGTPIATLAIISGTTDGNGDISDSRTYASDQPFTGRVRKASSTPYYKTGPFSGTIDSGSGASTTVQMIEDA